VTTPIRRSLNFSFLWFVLSTGCGQASAPAPEPRAAPGAPRAESAGSTALNMAPTPYTADEIRASNGPGTVYRYKVEASGEPTRLVVMEFTAGTSLESAEVRNESLDESGHATSPAKLVRMGWDELRRHAEFPRAGLTVEAGSIDVPAGKFDVMLYTVRGPEGETNRFYFAKSFAGPPVFLVTERGGVRVRSQALLERKAGREPAAGPSSQVPFAASAESS
jgi:hypothetical protein